MMNTLLLVSLFSLAGCYQKSLTSNQNEAQAQEKEQTTTEYNSVIDYTESITDFPNKKAHSFMGGSVRMDKQIVAKIIGLETNVIY